MKNSAVMYVRVSNKGTQKYERQIEDLTVMAKGLNLKIVKIFSEKVSAFSTKIEDRPQIQSMNNYIDDNEIKHILVSELSRIARDSLDTQLWVRDLNQKKITLYVHKGNLRTIKEDGTIDDGIDFLIPILSKIDEQESKRLSYRIKSGKSKAAIDGKGFSPKIFGYKKDENGKPILDEEQSVLVKKLFEMAGDGIGVRTISNYMNEHHPIKKWTGATIHSILRNSFFKGERKYNKTIDIDKDGKKIKELMIIEVPEIVSKELWDKANKYIDSRSRFRGMKGRNVNPLQTFIRCKCGSVMGQVVSVKGRTNSYVCLSKCGIKSVNRIWTINEVRTIVERNASLTKQEDTRERLKEDIVNYKASNESLFKEERTTKARIKRTTTIYRDGNFTKEQYQEYNNDDESKLSICSDKIRNNKESISNIEKMLSGVITHFSEDPAVFQSQLYEVLEYIEVTKELLFVKMKDFPKAVIPIIRGHELFLFNRGNLDFDSFYEKKWGDEIDKRNK